MSRRRLAYLETVKRDLFQGDQPCLLARYQHLVEIERQAEVPKRRRVVRAQTNWNTMVQTFNTDAIGCMSIEVV